MQLGMIGLGRMGANMVRRLMRAGHDCVVYDVSPDAGQGTRRRGRDRLGVDGGLRRQAREAAIDLADGSGCRGRRNARRVGPALDEGDAVIDGGNSYYRDDIRRAKRLAEDGIHYVDVGTSGGVLGLDRGYCLMIGGDDEAVGRLDPIFATLAPGVDAAPRTPGRDGRSRTAEQGYLHCGPTARATS